jgi:hypothetical protein
MKDRITKSVFHLNWQILIKKKAKMNAKLIR